ncbi:MAG TPA: ribonuclease III [Candidatus Ratteibacteria bacterium]|nr:ribonuclease III [Candidatus Ratteibacteria bacterium]
MQDIEKIIDYEFKNKKLLEIALTHSSFSTQNSNERFEFIGDLILNFIVGISIFKKFPDKDEGFYTNLKSGYVNQHYLNSLGEKLEIAKYIKYKGTKPIDLSDFIESIIGAIYLDGGLRKAERFVKKFILSNKIEPLIDYKGELITISRKLSGKLPSYEIIDEKGPAHKKNYKVIVKIEGIASKGEGEGKSKKEAEIKAAKDILTKILD